MSNIISKIVNHFGLVNKHRWTVFKLCIKAGIPYRGLVHDLSKYSITEFWESVKYYNGSRSPISYAKKDKGYSKAWLHHKGRNKHHAEYWYDNNSPEPMPVIPYKYQVEMLCDNLAAGMTYNGKRWKKDTQLNYWNEAKKTMLLNEKNKAFMTEALTQVSINGVDKTLKSKNLKRLYAKNCER